MSEDVNDCRPAPDSVVPFRITALCGLCDGPLGSSRLTVVRGSHREAACHPCYAALGPRQAEIVALQGSRIGGPRSAALLPGSSSCHRCGTNWGFVQGHTVWVARPCGFLGTQPVGGMFVYCEACWAEADLRERLNAVRSQYDDWKRDGHEPYTWEEFRLAVEAEETVRPAAEVGA